MNEKSFFYDSNSDIFRATMNPYESHETIYLQSASIRREEGFNSIYSRGDFSIPGSCYIEDTGHFNAVEFLISYNQLLYMTLAHCVHNKYIPELSCWSIHDFWDHQLPHILIQDSTMRFSSPINARSYEGSLRIDKIDSSSLNRGILKLGTSVYFSDREHNWGESGGKRDKAQARGEIRLAIISLPSSKEKGNFIENAEPEVV